MKILKNVLLTIFMVVFSAIVKVALQTYGSLLSSIIGVLVFLTMYVLCTIWQMHQKNKKKTGTEDEGAAIENKATVKKEKKPQKVDMVMVALIVASPFIIAATIVICAQFQ